MKNNYISYVAAAFMTIASSEASHALTDSEMSLASYAKRGEFVATPDIKALIAWADNEELYTKCGISDIENLSQTDRDELVQGLEPLLKVDSNHFQGFLTALNHSGLDRILQDKVLLILFAYTYDTQ